MKRQKSDFEYFLYQNYDRFLQKAETILEEAKTNPLLEGRDAVRGGTRYREDRI